MSLSVTQRPPHRELDAPKLDTNISQHSQSRAQIDSPSVDIYSPSADADESCPDTTSASMISTKRQASVSGAPALPAKSSLRASRCLDGLVSHKLAPHDVYLSSEEDASSSADDFSDFELESASEKSQPSKRRASHEDTARLVSVVFAGKPSMVNLPRRSSSPIPSEVSSRPSSRLSSSSRPPSRLRRTSTLPVTLPVLDRRMSLLTSSSGSILHPPRTSSMEPRKLEKKRPEFLSIDPFAGKTEPEGKEEQNERPKTPKTPTGMFMRTLSLVKKRSRPSLNTHFASQSRDNLGLFTPTLPMEQVREESSTESESLPSRTPTPILNKAPTYHEIVKSASRRTSTAPVSPMSEPASPMTPNSTRSRLRLGIAAAAARRRSVRA
ncbi:hypothetical protein FZEAL_8925 [Fusarium zealandicum]|uniref:Uncharacterized protein n=1 Tax=Fusarium zealandicum TaxID=1053134 RepID=A0A8H4UCX9_9HYPO|nr:hypothetical protein FZEAL_8925 [Fusarium zealandicum]